jgi:hypothetical protein
VSDEDPNAAPIAAPDAPKKVIGRPFPKGSSANPRGMKPGTKHRKTLLLAGMSDEDRATIVATIIRQARKGCRASQRMIVDRIEPPRHGSPVRFPLAPIVTVADIVKAHAEILAALSKGRLTPQEAMEVAGVVELARRAIETEQLETRIATMEAKFR